MDCFPLMLPPVTGMTFSVGPSVYECWCAMGTSSGANDVIWAHKLRSSTPSLLRQHLWEATQANTFSICTTYSSTIARDALQLPTLFSRSPAYLRTLHQPGGKHSAPTCRGPSAVQRRCHPRSNRAFSRNRACPNLASTARENTRLRTAWRADRSKNRHAGGR